ncbi:hypothetical protein MRX96_039761 [Rhipicephalus microplus]
MSGSSGEKAKEWKGSEIAMPKSADWAALQALSENKAGAVSYEARVRGSSKPDRGLGRDELGSLAARWTTERGFEMGNEPLAKLRALFGQ